jgi:hypothetical protein
MFRSGVVGFAMLCDICCNYPLWITAKRIGAHLSPFPKDIRMLYQVRCLSHLCSLTITTGWWDLMVLSWANNNSRRSCDTIFETIH